MDLLKLNIFRAGVFKQARFLVSTPTQAQKCIYIGEAGTASQEIQPINTGFVSADAVKKAWLVLHQLKYQVLKDGQPYQDEAVLVITDRSYFPYDAQGNLSDDEREKIINLKSIAKMRHAQARTETGKDEDPRSHLFQTIVTGGFMLLAFIGVAALMFRSCGS